MEFISLCCRAESFAALHRIFPRVFLHFVSDYFVEVYIKYIGHLDAVDHHVGELLVHVFPVAVARFVAPLEALEQLARFYAHRFRHVGGRVELLPVAVCAELVDHAERVVGDHGCHGSKAIAGGGCGVIKGTYGNRTGCEQKMLFCLYWANLIAGEHPAVNSPTFEGA